MKLKEINIDI